MTAFTAFRVVKGHLAAAFLAGAACYGASLASPAVAAAQTQEELDRARSLFREGLSLEAAGNWAAALAKFQDVGHVRLTPQVRFHVARCQENLGRLNEALGEYRLAEYEAGQQNLPELEMISESRQQLEARMPKVVIRRGDGAEQSRVHLDGVELGEIQVGEPVNVDPGPHRALARLPDGTQFEQTFTAAVGETVEVELVLPEAMRAQPAATAATTGPAEVDRGTQGGGPGALPWIVGGVGVASLAASGVFFLLRNGAESDLDEVCRGSVCPESSRDTQDKGEMYSMISTVTLGVGVVGVGVATYLFIAGSSGSESAALRTLPVDVGIAATGRDGAVQLRGRF